MFAVVLWIVGIILKRGVSGVPHHPEGWCGVVAADTINATMISRTRRLIIVAGMIVLMSISANTVVISSIPSPPTSYKKMTPGGQFVFVMLADSSYFLNEYVPPVGIDGTESGVLKLQKSYERSGMYRNDGSSEPLWTVDWYAYEVEVASDGVHLIRPRYSVRSLDHPAVSFYADGKLLRTWMVQELIDSPKLVPQWSVGFIWCDHAQYDDVRREYVITTSDGNRCTFDVVSGTLKSKIRIPVVVPPSLWPPVATAAVVFFCFNVALFQRRASRTRSTLQQVR